METSNIKENELIVAEKVARFIVDHGFATPAILFIELNRPLNYVASQGMALFEPFIKAFVVKNDYSEFVNFLEKRDSIDIIIDMIERYDKEKREEQKVIKKAKKNKKRS